MISRTTVISSKHLQEVGNIYPKYYLKAFYDGMTAKGDTVNQAIHSAWASAAKYGALVWSGDIVSTFECFRRQVQAGLNMAIAGIPWWTTDIGGFHGARTDDGFSIVCTSAGLSTDASVCHASAPKPQSTGGLRCRADRLRQR